MELNTTYNIKELEDNLSRLKTVDLKQESYEYIFELIKNIFSNIICQIIPVKVNPIFRGRINENKSFNNIEQLIYPKPELLTKFGRLTKPKNPILYASQREEIAIFEIQPKINDLITTVEFKLKPNIIDLQTFEIGVREKFWNNIPHVLDRESDIKISDEYREIVKKVESFFSDEFAQNISENETYRYKITAAISEMTFIKNQFAECLLYPSIASFMDGLNVGIKPQVFLDKYFATRVTEFKVVSMYIKNNYKRYDVRCIKTTQKIDSNGFIEW